MIITVKYENTINLSKNIETLEHNIKKNLKKKCNHLQANFYIIFFIKKHFISDHTFFVEMNNKIFNELVNFYKKKLMDIKKKQINTFN